jgi:5-methylcytosine-specific restriction endonuclease McrA
MIRKIRSGKHSLFNVKHYHLIEPEVPHVQSYASLLSLNQYLQENDPDFIKYDIREKIEFSRNFLHSVLKKEKTLQCVYCSKKGLIIEDEGMTVARTYKATTDHIIPISEGGKVFSYENVVVACEYCNNEKSNMSLIEFLKKYEHKLKPNYDILRRFL